MEESDWDILSLIDLGLSVLIVLMILTILKALKVLISLIYPYSKSLVKI